MADWHLTYCPPPPPPRGLRQTVRWGEVGVQNRGVAPGACYIKCRTTRPCVITHPPPHPSRGQWTRLCVCFVYFPILRRLGCFFCFFLFFVCFYVFFHHNVSSSFGLREQIFLLEAKMYVFCFISTCTTCIP